VPAKKKMMNKKKNPQLCQPHASIRNLGADPIEKAEEKGKQKDPLFSEAHGWPGKTRKKKDGIPNLNHVTAATKGKKPDTEKKNQRAKPGGRHRHQEKKRGEGVRRNPGKKGEKSGKSSETGGKITDSGKSAGSPRARKKNRACYNPYSLGAWAKKVSSNGGIPPTPVACFR